MRWFFLFLLLSCKTYTQAECEILSMKSFQGLLKESRLFKKHCQNRPIKHTREFCQKVLQTLILTGSRQAVGQKHGRQSLQCLTPGDFRKFIKN